MTQEPTQPDNLDQSSKSDSAGQFKGGVQGGEPSALGRLRETVEELAEMVLE